MAKSTSKKTLSLESILTEELESNIQHYLSLHLQDYHTEEYSYSSYNSPNSMYSINNNIDDLLLTLHHSSVTMWHKCLSMLKRSNKATSSCLVLMDYKLFDNLMSRNAYYKALKTLLLKRLLIATSHKKLYLVNISYVNKLYKPKETIK